MSAGLVVRDLGVAAASAPGVPLVADVSFAAVPGTAFTLVGASGAGKSLLAQAVMGTLPRGLVARGSVALDGEVTRAADAAARRPWWGRRITILPQEPWHSLDPTMRAGMQVAEVHRFVRGLDARTADARAAEELAALGLDAASCGLPSTLSGGMAQRVAFAATTAGGAPVLLVDEPTKGLDAALRDEVVARLADVCARGGIVVAITHDVAVARGLGGTVAVMRDARIVESGDTARVLAAPTHEYTRRLLAAEPSAWPAREAAAPGGPPILEGRGLAKRFGARTLFAEHDLDVRAGERVSILGPSGSGKTTLGNVLLGLVRPDAGTVRRLAGVAPHRFQKLYQDPAAAFAPRVTLRRSLADLAALHRIEWRAVGATIARLGLAESLLDRLPSGVSGGELQRIGLARAMLLAPVLLFADEPTSRLDPLTQRETFAALDETLDRHGTALVLVTHDHDIARRATDRVVRLDASTSDRVKGIA